MVLSWMKFTVERVVVLGHHDQILHNLLCLLKILLVNLPHQLELPYPQVQIDLPLLALIFTSRSDSFSS